MIQELRNQRAELAAKARKLLDTADSESRSINTEERNAYDAMIADVDKLGEQIETEQRKEKLVSIEQDLTKSVGRRSSPVMPSFNSGSRGEAREALRNWLLCGSEHADTSELAQYHGKQYGFNLHSRDASFHIGNLLTEKRVLTEGGSGTGAELAPQLFPQMFVEFLRYQCPILNYATIINTSNTNILPMPQVSDYGHIGAIVGEDTTMDSGSDIITSNVNLNAWKYTSYLQKVSIEFLLSAIANFEGRIAGLLAERIGLAFAAHAVATGNGSGQPSSLLSNAASSQTLATRGVILADDVLNLQYAVNKPYMDNGIYVCHQSVVGYLRTVKDGSGRYVWNDNFGTIVGGQNATLAGRPVLISNDMPTLATSGANKVLLYGDLKQYYVRMVDGVRFQRDESRFMELGEVAFVAIAFMDGQFCGPSVSMSSITNPSS